MFLGWLRSLLRRRDRNREDPAADMERARLRAEVGRDRDRAKDEALEAEARTTAQGPLP
jgi:hypothetical protein